MHVKLTPAFADLSYLLIYKPTTLMDVLLGYLGQSAKTLLGDPSPLPGVLVATQAAEKSYQRKRQLTCEEMKSHHRAFAGACCGPMVPACRALAYENVAFPADTDMHRNARTPMKKSNQRCRSPHLCLLTCKSSEIDLSGTNEANSKLVCLQADTTHAPCQESSIPLD